MVEVQRNGLYRASSNIDEVIVVKNIPTFELATEIDWALDEAYYLNRRRSALDYEDDD